MKAEKGITLVALVITIIVLLILAMVSITIVYNQGLIPTSQNAVNTHKEAADNETATLNEASENVQIKINEIKGAK